MKGADNIVAFPERSSIEEEAARWILRLEAGRLLDDEQRAFEAWRRASPVHQEVFDSLKGHWQGLDALSRPRSAIRPDSGLMPGRWRRPAMAALAAGLVAAVALTGVMMTRAPATQTSPNPGAANIYATEVGDLRVVKLEDGSTVTLNTDSQIEVTFSDRERRVDLKSGEAFFEVVHDVGRPFRVYAPGGVTTAVGTAFSVRVMDGGVNVVVSSGKVSFAEPKSAAQPVAFVSAGQSASFDDTRKYIETVPSDEVDRKLSWTHGRLVFRGAPLSDVVEDISRYTDIKIEIADPHLASRPIGGAFDVGEVDLMLEALGSGFGLEVERVDDSHVRIRDHGT